MTRPIYRAFTKACKDLGLEPQDPEVLLLLSSTAATTG